MKMRFPLALVGLFLLFGSAALAQKFSAEWVKERYQRKDVRIRMRDGIQLYTSVFHPKDKSEKHPILLVRTPYSCSPYGDSMVYGKLFESHLREYIKRDYVVVIQDVRGRFMSEGTFVDVRPFIENKKKKTDIDEASDAYDTVDWLVKNVENNNGKVGVTGISYPGFYAMMAAASGHPAIKAVSPQAPVTEWFLGDDFHHNGALMLQDGFSFYSVFGVPRPKPTTQFPAPFVYPSPDRYDFFLKSGSLKSISKFFGDSIAFWNDLMQHPNYDAWWQERDARRATKGLKPAMMVVGGTFDAEDCFGAWNLYQAIEKNNPGLNSRIVMGPWYHGGWSKSRGTDLGNVHFGSPTSEYYQQNLEVPFFEHFLRDKPSEKGLAEATIFFTGENQWREFSEWPPKAVNNQAIYFQRNGKLSWEKPKETAALTQYVSDPNKPVPYKEGIINDRTREYMIDDQRFVSNRPDVISFETPVLGQEVVLSGPVVADLKVKLNTTDADFVVKIIDVFPNDFKYDTALTHRAEKYPMGGYQMLVRGEIFRGRFRNSFSKPEPFKPGETTTVRFTLPDIAHTFQKGHRLMIQIQSSWFPLADRNPQQFVNPYTCEDSDFVPATIQILHQEDAASAVILPVLKK